MSERNTPDPFAPEEIEEQIARRLMADAPMDDESRLVRALAALYAAPGETSGAMLARARERVRAAPIPPAAERTTPGRTITLAALPDPSAPRGLGDHGAHRGRAWPALVAAAMIVALMAGLFHTLTAGRASQPPKPGQPTPTLSPTPTGTPTARDDWRTYPGLSVDPQPVLAPSDPRVAYVAGTEGNCLGCPPILRRTDDEGTHWGDLPLPIQLRQTQSFNMLVVLVSPLDAHTIILTASAYLSTPCPGGIAFRGFQDAKGCTTQFLSTDGGQSWRVLSLPTPGLLWAPVISAGSQLRSQVNSQGRFLYMTWTQINPGSMGGQLDGRLMLSRDGGATWQFVDQAIVSAGQAIYDVTATPDGTTVFALTDTAGVSLNFYTPHFQLWRSDDQGAHWQRSGSLPASSVAGMAAANGSDGQSVVYVQVSLIGAADSTGAGAVAAAHNPTGRPVVGRPLSMPLAGPGMTTHLYASVDGGQHWTTAPDPPASLSSDALLSLSTVLPNGEAVVLFSTSGAGPGVAFYGWNPGERQWRQLTPVLEGGLRYDLVRFIPAGPGGPAALWVIYENSRQALVASFPLTGV